MPRALSTLAMHPATLSEESFIMAGTSPAAHSYGIVSCALVAVVEVIVARVSA